MAHEAAARTGLRVAGSVACVVVPAYQAGKSLGAVLADLDHLVGAQGEAVIVVDDGSTDDTAEVARRAGVRVVSHERNRGKGAALLTGLAAARALGCRMALTVDADGQHPGESAREVLHASPDPRALVLGVRNLRKDGAPRANRFSNGISNFFLSVFAGQSLLDTQCGLRRYPVEETLALASQAPGYAFEAEVILRAAEAKLPIVQHEVKVIYPPEHERVTHFHSVRDPARIIVTVLRTVHELRRRGRNQDG